MLLTRTCRGSPQEAIGALNELARKLAHDEQVLSLHHPACPYVHVCVCV